MARVALLLSGLPRQWKQCAASQLALATGYDADVFFHFWDTIDEEEKNAIVSAYAPDCTSSRNRGTFWQKNRISRGGTTSIRRRAC